MAGYISKVQAVGNNLYLVLQSLTTGKFFTGAVMENYNGSNWSTYAQAMTENAGSGIYTYSISGSLPADTYTAFVFVRNGGSPVLGSDTPLYDDDFNWDGANLIWLGSSLNVGKINGSAPAAVNLAASANALVIGAAAAGTLTTAQMTTNLTDTVANIYAGRTLIFTSGVNVKLAVLITAYAVTGGRLTFVAYNNQPAPSAPSAADTFIIL